MFRIRELPAAKAAILRGLELEAVFSGNETQFLPESFFRQYPHLRGTRVDHPMPSAKDKSAFWVDSPQTLEMIEWMMAELELQAPERTSSCSARAWPAPCGKRPT